MDTGNRSGECLSGTWGVEVSTQHPLYFLRTHSRASFCASAISVSVICKLAQKTLSVYDFGIIGKVRKHHEIHYGTVNSVINIF